MNQATRIIDFVHDLDWATLPAPVQQTARNALLDLIGTALAGRAAPLSDMVRTVARQMYGGDDAALLFDGRRASAAGAAFANGMTIDAMDIHDGYRLAKGHAGVNVLPAALALAEGRSTSGREFMAALVAGYELALRAGVVLHDTACDYHTSGAWGALGAAAVAARMLGLDHAQTRHALGIAEYYGPRSQMMRCIDHPTMLKDGSGWGSMTGVMAACMAREGFTGAPALLVEQDGAEQWATLGERWLLPEMYFKPYACCRWAQPAVEAALELQAAHAITPPAIDRIAVHTFAAATRLAVTHPATTEQAQYSLPYPVAAALTDGTVGPQQVLPPRIHDPALTGLAARVTMHVDAALEEQFPARALGRVVLHTTGGATYESGVHATHGDPDDPMDWDEIVAKFAALAQPHLDRDRQQQIVDRVADIAAAGTVAPLLAAITAPLDAGARR
jgi:2-methylcitrate dehydratase PrpD